MRAWYRILLLAAAACLSIVAVQPPPRSADAPEGAFAASRALAHVRAIAAEPHPVGSPAQAAVRRYLVDALDRMGLMPSLQQEQPGGPVNIIGRLKGARSSGALLLVAHYDSAPGSPGGADNASGVAAVLEVLRALRAGGPLRNDVLVLLSDGEEAGLLGARAFAASHPAMKEVRAALNLDTASFGPIILVAGRPQESWLVSELSRLRPAPLSSSAIRTVYSLMPFNNDLLPLSEHGVPGAWLTSVAPFPQNHTPADTPAVVQSGSLQAMGDLALQWVRQFGNLDLNAPRPPDAGAIYLTLPGLLVHYPAGWALPLAGGISLLYTLLTAWALRRGRASAKGLALASGAATAALVADALAALLLWQGAQALFSPLRPAGAFVHTPADGAVALAVCAVALVPALALRRWAARRTRGEEHALGAMLPWLAGLLLSSLYLPAASYAFALPLLGTLPAHGLSEILGARGRAALALLGALPGVLIWAPSMYLLYMGTALAFLPALAAGVAMLWSLVSLPESASPEHAGVQRPRWSVS